MASHAVKATMPAGRTTANQEFGLLIPIIALLGLSIVMVFSASMSASSLEQGPALSVLRQQGLFVFLAVMLMIAVSRIPLSLVEKSGPLLVILSMLVLSTPSRAIRALAASTTNCCRALRSIILRDIL